MPPAGWLESATTLLEYHRRQHNMLTVCCQRGTRAPAGVYVCDPEVLKHIPEVGYCDIKEQLIPRLLQRGQRVGAMFLNNRTGEVLGTQSYFSLQHRVLYDLMEGREETLLAGFSQLAPGVWLAADAFVGDRARLIGPVVIGPGAIVEDAPSSSDPQPSARVRSSARTRSSPSVRCGPVPSFLLDPDVTSRLFPPVFLNPEPAGDLC